MKKAYAHGLNKDHTKMSLDNEQEDEWHPEELLDPAWEKRQMKVGT